MAHVGLMFAQVGRRRPPGISTPVESGPVEAKIGPRWAKMRPREGKVRPIWAKVTKGGAKVRQDGATVGQDGATMRPKWGHDDAKMGPR